MAWQCSPPAFATSNTSLLTENNPKKVPETLHYCIDIGNSRIKTAAFLPNGEIRTQQDFSSEAWEEISAYLTNLPAKNIIYSSVANEPPSSWISQQLGLKRRIWALDGLGKLPFRSQYETMNTLGKDRVAAIAGAMFLYPAMNCLIVDAGTCVTMDLLSAEGLFVGGNISPGLQIRLRAMHDYTARLPLVKPQDLGGILLGKSTESALRQGGQGGPAYEIEGLYRRLVAEYPNLNVILTGGDAAQISSHLVVAHTVQPFLVLQGLFKIMSFYADQTV